MKITLCLLTLNELPGCKHDLPKILRLVDAYDDLYVIDGGSTDGTLEYLKSQKITTIVQKITGLNAAYKLAFKHCKTEAIIFFHPKGSIPVKDISRFRAYFNTYGFVIGSRMMKKSSNEEDVKLFRPRKWGVLLLSFLLYGLYAKTDYRITDVMHGFRGLTISAYKQMNLQGNFPSTYDVEMVMSAYKNNISTIEFPTTETQRISGFTHFRFWPTARSVFKLLISDFIKW